jgi:hypothetical protein
MGMAIEHGQRAETDGLNKGPFTGPVSTDRKLEPDDWLVLRSGRRLDS